ncbi:MAG: ABC transporter substrate-binding protein [Pseudomonadota bacterium]
MPIFRQFLAGIAMLAVLALPQPAHAETEIEIGYMPILPVSQLFVGLEEGWYAEAGATVKLVEFQNGPAMVQALLAGQLDVAHFGIGPAMVARAKGADIKVVAASIIEQISFVAQPELAKAFADGDAETAFQRFSEEHGRRPVITTFPVGSVPQTVLRYWIDKQIGANHEDAEIIYQGAAQVQQALLTGAVDGAAILEPIVTTTLNRVPEATVVAKGSAMFPGQPGAILAVREGLIAQNPDLVRALVAAHKRATDQLNADPSGTAPHVQKYVGGGRLPLETVEQALKSTSGSFVSNPSAIIAGAQSMHDFQEEIGTLKAKVDIDALFDAGFYPVGQ